MPIITCGVLEKSQHRISEKTDFVPRDSTNPATVVPTVFQEGIIMKNTHRNLWFVSALAVLLLLGAAVIPVTADSPASAETLFSIPGKTTLVSLSDNADVAAYSTTPDYGPLNIPSALLPQTNVRSATPAYQLASFDNVIPVRSNTVSLPITLYGQSYTIPLTRMTFESIDDGIDTYQGTVPGIADSLVIVTVADDNLFYGSITLPNDNIEIYPVQNYNYTQITPAPLHIIYSENSIPDAPNGLTLSGMDSLSSIKEQLLSAMESTEAATTNTNQVAVVGFLVGTDEEFYYSGSNWIGQVQQLLGAITYSFEGPTGASPGVCAYDSTMTSVFSNDPRQFTNPLGLTEEVYWVYFLEQKNPDLALYEGGVDADGSLIAKGKAFGPSGRWAWIQMVPDHSTTAAAQVTGTVSARKYAAINALGYNFGATPSRATVTSSSATVMYTQYEGPSYNLLTFSPLNAAVISSNKNTVAGYV